MEISFRIQLRLILAPSPLIFQFKTIMEMMLFYEEVTLDSRSPWIGLPANQPSAFSEWILFCCVIL